MRFFEARKFAERGISLDFLILNQQFLADEVEAENSGKIIGVGQTYAIGIVAKGMKDIKKDFKPVKIEVTAEPPDPEKKNDVLETFTHIVALGVSDLMKRSMEPFMEWKNEDNRQRFMEMICMHVFEGAMTGIKDWNESHRTPKP